MIRKAEPRLDTFLLTALHVIKVSNQGLLPSPTRENCGYRHGKAYKHEFSIAQDYDSSGARSHSRTDTVFDCLPASFPRLEGK